ncbi:hypothetical protein X737_22810 [Mesorhizobium sp. L48C026A00]|nr:hypothetical protein X737_22810 [Mesorhizobium sp. L48C026A00]
MQVESGQTPEAVAKAAGVCPRTVRKWLDRYRAEEMPLRDRSSRPHRLRRPTPQAVNETIERRGTRDLRDWLFDQAEDARSNEDLAQRFVARWRETLTILPAVSTIERLCADALVDAERRIETRIAEKLDAGARERLDGLLTEMLAGNISRFILLRKFELGNNSAAANRLLDRLEFLRGGS